jgi:hypothetical protein
VRTAIKAVAMALLQTGSLQSLCARVADVLSGTAILPSDRSSRSSLIFRRTNESKLPIFRPVLFLWAAHWYACSPRAAFVIITSSGSGGLDRA